MRLNGTRKTSLAEKTRVGSGCPVHSTRSPLSRSSWKGSGTMSEDFAGIEGVAQAVAQVVDAEHGDEDRGAGEDRPVGREVEVIPGVGEDTSPGRDVRWEPDAEEGQ